MRAHQFYCGDLKYYPNCGFNDGIREKPRLRKRSRIESKQRYETRLKKWEMLTSFVKERKTKIIKEMDHYLGSADAVTITVRFNKITYKVQCPYRYCTYKGDRLDRHLQLRGKQGHNWSLNDAHLYKSRQIRLFSFLANVKHKGIVKPLPCKECYRYYDRLDTHLSTQHNLSKQIVIDKIKFARKYDNKYSVKIKTLQNFGIWSHTS